MKLDLSKRQQTSGCAEIGQQARNTYATCEVEGDTVYLTGVFYKCRDFAQDQLYDFTTGDHFNVWGYQTEKNPWDGKHMLCWYGHPDKVVRHAFDRLNDYIEERGLPRFEWTHIEAPEGLGTLMGSTSKDNNLWLVDANPIYTGSLFGKSLYTGLLRLVYWLGEQHDNDDDTVKILRDHVPSNSNEHMIVEMLEFRKDAFDVWKDGIMLALEKGFPNIAAAPEDEWAKWMESPESHSLHNTSGVKATYDLINAILKKQITTDDAKAALDGGFQFNKSLRRYAVQILSS